MFTYSLVPQKEKSLYIQLYELIKKDILSGKLRGGEKLPSKRAAAKHLGVSVITIENAYAELLGEGYIYSLPKKGYFVSEISALSPAPAPQNPTTAFVRKKENYRFDFSSNGVIPDNFPFSIWTKVMRSTFRDYKAQLMESSPAGGTEVLKQAICTHLKQFRGMEVQAEQIIIGAGTEYLYSLLIQFLGGTNVYALQNPGYARIAKIYESVGVQRVFIPEKADGIDPDALYKSNASIAHLSPSHSFPSGKVMHISERHKLLNWAGEKANRYIIEDDYDSEFRLAGRPLPTLQSMDRSDKVIYINTFTKSLSPTIRISYMVLPPSLVKAFYERLGFYSNTVSTFEQYTLARFMEQGYFEKHINRMRNYYKKLRDLLLAEIQSSSLAASCRISEEAAGLHFLLTVQTDIPDALLKQKAAKAGINISFLSEYYLEAGDTAPAHTIVMNYSAIAQEDIHAAWKALEAVITQ